jgi:NAD(P)-dependent dehydrogenase (short-subunit alcohol dehydrogenase family)
VWTPLNPSDNRSPGEVSHFGEKTALKRPAQPEEVAPADVFLPPTRIPVFITGEVLTLLGGETTAA